MKMKVITFTPQSAAVCVPFMTQWLIDHKDHEDHKLSCPRCFPDLMCSVWLGQKDEYEEFIDITLLPYEVTHPELVHTIYEGKVIDGKPYVIIDGMITNAEDIEHVIAAIPGELDVNEMLANIEAEQTYKPSDSGVQVRIITGSGFSSLQAALRQLFNERRRRRR